MTKKCKCQNHAELPVVDDMSFLDQCEDFDDEMMCDDMCDSSEDAMAGFMISAINAASHQMTLTSELTKIVVENNAKKMTTEEIFAVFKQAAQVVAETSPLKNLIKEVSEKE